MTDQEHHPQGLIKRIFGNLGWLLGGKAAAGIISLVYMIIAARALGPHDYGVLVLIHAYILSVDGLVNFPAWQTVVRYGYRPLREGRFADLVALMRFTGSVELVIGVFAVAAAALFSGFIGHKLAWPPEAYAFAIPYSLAALANTRSTPAGYLQLVRRFDLLGWHNSVSPAVRLIGAFLAAALGWGLSGFLWVWLIAALLEFASMWVFGLLVARKNLHGEAIIGPVRDLRQELPGVSQFMISAKADTTLSQLAPQMVPLIIGWVLGPAAAGIFAIAQRATNVIAQPAQILGQAAYSEFSKLLSIDADFPAVWRAIIRTATIAMSAAAPMVIIMVFFSHRIAVLLGGEEFAAAGALMAWLGLARMIQIIMPLAGSALVAAGRPALSIGSSFVATILMLPLLPLTLNEWGLKGCAWFLVVQACIGSGLALGLFRLQSRWKRGATA